MLSSQILNIPKDGRSTTWLCKIVQCLTTSKQKKKTFPSIQIQFPILEFLPAASCSVSGQKKRQKSLAPFSSFLPFSYLHTAVVAHELSLLQVEESQLSQHLLMWWILKSIKNWSCAGVIPITPLLLWNPQHPDGTSAVLIRVEGSSAGHVNPAPLPQDTLLVYVQFIVHHDLKVPFCRAAFQLA